jgi:hypothetical protein
VLSSLFPGRRITSATPPRAALQGGPSAFLQDAAYITGTSLFLSASLSVVPSVGETTVVAHPAARGRLRRPYPAGGWPFRSVGAVGAIVVSPTDRHGTGGDAAAR